MSNLFQQWFFLFFSYYRQYVLIVPSVVQSSVSNEACVHLLHLNEGIFLNVTLEYNTESYPLWKGSVTPSHFSQCFSFTVQNLYSSIHFSEEEEGKHPVKIEEDSFIAWTWLYSIWVYLIYSSPASLLMCLSLSTVQCHFPLSTHISLLEDMRNWIKTFPKLDSASSEMNKGR